MVHLGLWSQKNEFNSHYYNMLLTAILSAITVISTSLCLCTNPLAIGLTILTMALLLTLLFAIFISSWFAFLIFLIYIGGILVMFSYFVSISPNQVIPPILMLISWLLSSTILTLLIYTTNIQLTIIPLNQQFTATLFLPPAIPTIIILATILLLAILIVVKLTIRTKGPLRPFYNYV